MRPSIDVVLRFAHCPSLDGHALRTKSRLDYQPARDAAEVMRVFKRLATRIVRWPVVSFSYVVVGLIYVARRVWRIFIAGVRSPEWISTVATATGLFLTGLALYVDKVYERTELAAVITDNRLDKSQKTYTFQAMFENRGTTPVVIISADVVFLPVGPPVLPTRDMPGIGPFTEEPALPMAIGPREIKFLRGSLALQALKRLAA